jgi:hypothetical protein
MRQTDRCPQCGGPKSNLVANYCETCFSQAEGARAAAVAEGKDGDKAYREALNARAHRAHNNFPDPRAMDRKTIWLYGNLPPQQ